MRFLLKGDHFHHLPFSIIIIFGLCLITTIAGYLSLFIKIGFVANLIILIGALLIGGRYFDGIIRIVKLTYPRFLNINKYIFALSIIIFLFVLVKSTNPPSPFDTGLYHAQAIRWIEEYRAVPGLGNLHGRLAFNSMWFLPNALFGFSFLKLQPFHVLNGFFLMIIVMISMDGLSNLLKKQYNFTNILKSGMSIPAIFIFKDQLSSPIPEIPVALLVCVLVIYCFQIKEKIDDVPADIIAVIIVLLSVFAVTIKLSALPLLLFVLLMPTTKIVAARPVNIIIIAGLILGLSLPFLLRNIVLSGYLVYPFSAIDWFHFDWKIPASQVLAEKQGIEAFARGGIAVQELGKGIYYWLPLWFHGAITDYGSKLEKILLPSLLLGADYLYKVVAAKHLACQLREINKNIVPYLVASLGIIFWFLTAPDFRFVMGFLLVFAIIIFMPFLKPFNYRVTKFFPWATALLLLYFALAFLPKDLPFLGQRLWFPAPYPQPRLAATELQGKIVYYPQEQSPLCWYAPLPCTYTDPSSFMFRGETVQDGFRAR